MSNDEIVYRPGDVLAGKYRVDKVVGVGGFGAVLQATHLQLEERVAIKTLLPHAAKNAAASERFLREARAAVRIRSEHVARVSDVGKLDDGTPYMVMEFLDGTDLSNLVKDKGMQPFSDVAEWVIQASEAIAEAHSLGIVHRDLKPANLFLTRRVDGTPNIKVLDFGISKLTNETGDKGMTKTSDVMGSPFYMSPEQMRSTRSVDARCDIWAMGAIVYELIAGCTPFDAETMTALVVNIMQEPPREILSFRRDVPPQLRDVVLRCLQKDPNARFQDVASLAHALAPFAPARAQANLARITAISGKAAPTSGAAGVTPTVAAAPMHASQAHSSQAHAHPSHATMGGGGPGSQLLAEQARLTPSGATGGPAYPSPASGGFAPASGGAPMHSPMHPTMVAGHGVAGHGFADSAAQSGPLVVAAPVPNGPSQSWGGTMATKRSSNAPIFVGVGALLLAGLGGGGFFMLRAQSAGTSPSPAAQTATTAAPPADKPADKPAEAPTGKPSAEPQSADTALPDKTPSDPTVKPTATNTTTAPAGKPTATVTQTAPPPSKPEPPVIVMPTTTTTQTATTPPKPPKKPGLFDGTD